MNAFSRSWEITKATFKVMEQDKAMLLFPIIGGIASIILFILFIIPFLSTTIITNVAGQELGTITFYVVLFLFYLCIAFIATFCNVAVVYIAKNRFEGKRATFGDALSFAFSQIKEILLWSIFTAIIGVVLKILENAARNRSGPGGFGILIVRSIIGAAWSIATIFVVPIIVYKDLSPFGAIKESVYTLKKTWGESIIRVIGLGLVQTALAVTGIVVGLILAFLSLAAGVPLLLIIVIGLTILYLVLLSIIFSVANAIFNTALYVYATTGKVPLAYQKANLQNAVQSRPNTI